MKKGLVPLILSCLFSSSIYASSTPYNELNISTVSLNNYPKKINKHAAGIEITIGDLHGNALKLIYFLINNNVVTLSKEHYKELLNIYKKDLNQLSDKDLALFQEMINDATYNTQQSIRFLGDDLCDRGMNDFFTLMIYKKLDTEHVPFEIVLSNHGNFFISAYEKPNHPFNLNPYGEGHNESTVQSMLRMAKLMDKGLVDKQEIVDTVQNHYLKHLKFPAYTVNKKKKEITIYSHAPIDLAMLEALAKDLQTPYQDKSLEELTTSLDAINARISEWILSNSFSSHYIDLLEAHKKSNSLSPLNQVLWNRDYSILKRENPLEGKPYKVNYVHGHDSMPNVFDLDNLFGKGPRQYRGPYAVFLTHA